MSDPGPYDALIEAAYARWDVDQSRCPFCLSAWQAPRPLAVHAGAMEGDWVLTECSGCNTGTVALRDGGSGFDHFLSALGNALMRKADR